MYKKLLIRVLMSHEIRFKYLENHSAFGLLLRALAPVIIVPTYIDECSTASHAHHAHKLSTGKADSHGLRSIRARENRLGKVRSDGLFRLHNCVTNYTPGAECFLAGSACDLFCPKKNFSSFFSSCGLRATRHLIYQPAHDQQPAPTTPIDRFGENILV